MTTDIEAELRSLAAYAYVGSYVRERLLRAADEIVRLRRDAVEPPETGPWPGSHYMDERMAPAEAEEAVRRGMERHFNECEQQPHVSQSCWH